MLFMILIKSTLASEKGEMPTKDSMNQMNMYNDALIGAGIKVMAKGLYPSSEGFRKSFTNPEILTNGPFSDAISGFFIIEVNS